jgi:bacillithiol biosynthesis cysteine-adding enzyme BshC
MRVVPHSLGAIPPLAPRSASWNQALDAAIVRSAGCEAQLERLRQPGALVVTTGQQPGLFTGPLYTIHKALAAAALARRLESEWRRPVIPLLWVAGDDHDWAEASGAAWLDTDGRLAQWRLPGRPASAPQLPMYREPVPPETEAGLRALESSLPAIADRDATIGWLRRHYRADATLHSAAAGALAELLAPHGVLVFDPTHIVMKRAQASLLATALARAGELDAMLAALPPLEGGVSVGDGATLVFLETTAGRERLVADGERFRTRRSGESFTRADLEQLLAVSPERFSPNALLRPVVEAAVLPTLGYVGGPGELRYLNQQAAFLYQPLDVWRQPPIPRWSGTVVESWADRLLERLDISLDALLSDDNGALGRSILRRDLPGAIADSLATLRAQLASDGDTIRAAGNTIDPVLDRAIAGRQRKIANILDDLQHVIERHLRRRDDIAWAQYRRLRTGLRPQDAPQERVFTAATFRARHGDAWLRALGEATDAWVTWP